jgi:hypothetical protein
MSYRANLQNQSLGYGVKTYAYLPDITNPLFNAFGTSGIVPLMRWDIYEGANLWVNPALPVVGLPGVQAGQAILQPLLDTRTGVNGL